MAQLWSAWLELRLRRQQLICERRLKREEMEMGGPAGVSGGAGVEPGAVTVEESSAGGTSAVANTQASEEKKAAPIPSAAADDDDSPAGVSAPPPPSCVPIFPPHSPTAFPPLDGPDPSVGGARAARARARAAAAAWGGSETAHPSKGDTEAEEGGVGGGAVHKSVRGFATRLLNPSRLLNARRAQQLEEVLPTSQQGYDWDLIYSLPVHGASLSTLVSRARGRSPSLIVLRDATGSVFGGYAASVWQPPASGSGGSGRYFGDGQNFVFSFDRHTDELKCHHWTGANDYFMLLSDGGIGMGGGGHFAFFLDADLCNGSSGACETFGSPPLTSVVAVGDNTGGAPNIEGSSTSATIVHEFCAECVELWGFVLPDEIE